MVLLYYYLKKYDLNNDKMIYIMCVINIKILWYKYNFY